LSPSPAKPRRAEESFDLNSCKALTRAFPLARQRSVPMPTRSLAAAFLALVFTAACSTTQTNAPVAPRSNASDAAAAITAESLAARVRFLSDDLLEGRAPGTRGDRLARLYIATEMAAIGLQPAAPNGGWEQLVPLVGVTSTLPRGWDFVRGRKRLRLRAGDDFVVASGVVADDVKVHDAEVVFVGYGIQAPEYGWDDFKGADLHGKVLLFLNDDPDWDPQLFAGKRRLYYGRWTYKYESAARQGALGAIVLHTEASAGYPWQTVQTSFSGEISRLPGGERPALQVEAWITEDAATRLVALAGHRLAELVGRARSRDFTPVSLGVSTSLQLHNRVRRYESANVLGMLPGIDPARRGELVVYTAHHDHLGMKRGPSGEVQIYNGALDNAAGVAQLLAVAQAFRALPAPPARSILFAAVAAEEQGLLGSAYLVAHPPVPPARMAADLNIDGANIWGPTRDVAEVGYGKSTLDRFTVAAAARQGRVLTDEPFPERGSFYRSDQFNFARAGVPSLFLHPGIDFVGRPAGWGSEHLEAWIEEHYHQPSDDFGPDWNLDGMVQDTRLLFAVGRAVADSAAMPQWNAGDEFEAIRQRSLAEQ
jgi:Zn-dependent M28 family amino/carboxypeptidase